MYRGVSQTVMWDVKRREKAHGVDPRWRKGIYKNLSVECPQRFRDINLHWHDLRHEYASRLVKRGVPLAQVRTGSATRRSSRPSATTTNAWKRCKQPSNGWKGARRSIRRPKPRTTCPPKRPRPLPRRRNFQESFKIPPNRTSQTARPRRGLRYKSLRSRGMESWYRYGVLRKVGT
jgi:hypothetical protein